MFWMGKSIHGGFTIAPNVIAATVSALFQGTFIREVWMSIGELEYLEYMGEKWLYGDLKFTILKYINI